MMGDHQSKMFQAREQLILTSQKYQYIPMDVIHQNMPKLIDLSQNYIGDWPSQHDLPKNRDLETLII